MVRAFRKEDGTPPPQLLPVSQQVQRVSHQGTLRQASPQFQLGRGPDSGPDSVHHFGAERSCICFGGASLTSRMSDHGDDQCRSIAVCIGSRTSLRGCVSSLDRKMCAANLDWNWVGTAFLCSQYAMCTFAHHPFPKAEPRVRATDPHGGH